MIKKEYIKPMLKKLEILVEMTPEEQKKQEVSFVYGNLELDGSKAEREQISEIYDSMKKGDYK